MVFVYIANNKCRGFAVVVDEVRTWASRAQAFTKEIQNMIVQFNSMGH